MWWEPSNDHERSLKDDVRHLQIWFSEQRHQEPPLAFGYGSIWSSDHDALMPLVLLNTERLVGFPHERMARLEPVPIEFLEYLRDPARKPEPLRFPKLTLPLYFLPSRTPRKSGFVEDLFDEMLSVRDPIQCAMTGEQGTAGVSVFHAGDGTRALLTAGHVFPNGVASPVLQVKSRFPLFPRLLPRRIPIGKVAHHVVPSGITPEWDAAIIELDQPLRAGAAVTMNHLRRFERQEGVVAYGAFSGVVRNAQVHGGLETLSGEHIHTGKQIEWKNCWIAAPSGILGPGDSGAAVFTRKDRSFLGLYIARSTVGGEVGAHYVQDSYALEQEVLNRWGFSF